MSAVHAKLSEVSVASVAVTWVPVALFKQVSAIGVIADADSPEVLTVQLRKATDASGTGATNWGTAVTATSAAADSDLSAIQTEEVDSIGAGYTHVAAVISSDASPETPTGVVLRTNPRYSN